MTQKEWLTCTDTQSLWESPYLWRSDCASERKYRLFAVACTRRLWSRFEIAACRRAVEVSEHYADGLGYGRRVRGGGKEIEALTEQCTLSDDDHWLLGIAASHSWDRSYRLAGQVSADCVHVLGQSFNGPEEQAQCDIIRDLFPGPTHAVSADFAWHAPEVLLIARRMYDSRDFSAMPVLADTLQAIGCNDPLVLAHCRNVGAHVRGCWVVDLLLGKE